MDQASCIALPAGTIRYIDRGAGPVLLFIHGVFVNGGLWREITARLDGRFRCIVPTLPLGAHDVPMPAGKPLTPLVLAQLIADLIGTLDLHDVTLVGNDTGGALCQLVAVHHPARIARLVLTNCDSFERFPPAVLRPLYAGARVPGAVWCFAQLLRSPFVQRAFFRTVAHRIPERAYLAALFRPLSTTAAVRGDLAAFLAAVDASDLTAAAAHFGTFAGRVLVAWGEDDAFFPLRDARRLAAAFPRASLVPIARSRTFVPEDQPMALAESIERFVAAAAAAA